MAKILSGKKVRDKIAEDLTKKIKTLKSKPHLAIIQVGDLDESNAYIRQKKLFGERIGAIVTHIRLPSGIKEKDLILRIKKLNADKNLQGIIVQMPIPAKLDREKILETIDPDKDVDGLHSKNVKRMWEGKNDGHVPATAKGVLTLLKYYKVPLKGRRVVVVGRSILVGQPIALALLNEAATITIAHRHSKNLPFITKDAHIIVVAAGVPKLIGKKNVSKGQVIIDVGINLIENKKRRKKLEEELRTKRMVGDVDFEPVSRIVRAISPVPGGVGPMTVASLFLNLVEAHSRQKGVSI